MTAACRRLQRSASAALLALLGIGAGATPTPVGRWFGEYICGQGGTALELLVEAGKGDSIQAWFHFQATPKNPAVPEGCFAMAGSFAPAELALRLAPGEWRLRPPDYVGVGLVGQLNVAGDRMTGSVDGPLCTSFALSRAAALPALPSACTGKPTS